MHLELKQSGFSQVIYEDQDRLPQPEYTSFRITGWMPTTTLTNQVQRHFFHLTTEDTFPRGDWVVVTDHHEFRPFWALLKSLPMIIYPQNTWLENACN